MGLSFEMTSAPRTYEMLIKKVTNTSADSKLNNKFKPGIKTFLFLKKKYPKREIYGHKRATN